MKNKRYIVMLMVSVGILISFIVFNINNVYSLSKYGSRGNEVKQIQTKLKNWGYYTGNVDRKVWK